LINDLKDSFKAISSNFWNPNSPILCFVGETGLHFSLNLNGENRLYSEKELKCDSDAGRGRHIFSAINHHESNHLQVFLVGLADAKRRH